MIDKALQDGELLGSDGESTNWELRRGHPAEVSEHERDHAARLTQT
jgi:hypothetical protein